METRAANHARLNHQKIQQILKDRGIQRGHTEIPKGARISNKVPQFPRAILYEFLLSRKAQERILELKPKPAEHHIRMAIFLQHGLTDMEAYRATYPDAHLARSLKQAELQDRKPAKEEEIREQQIQEEVAFELETKTYQTKARSTANNIQVRSTLAILRQEADLQLLDTVDPTPKKLVARLNSIAEKLAERTRITQADAETLKNLYHEIILIQQLPSYDRDIIEMEEAPESLSYEDLVLRLSSDA